MTKNKIYPGRCAFPTINVINKSSNPLPEYKSDGDAGMDLRADFTNGFNEDLAVGAAWDATAGCVHLFSGGRCIIPTGLYTSFDKNYKLEIVPRSGLAIKNGVTVLNTPGTIDANYRGEIGVILMNLGDECFDIYPGDRIAQAILVPITTFVWNEVESLEDSDRGECGFGSTGVK